MAGVRNNFEKELRQKLDQKSTTRMSEETILLRAFKYFDLDNSGCVSFSEWLKALEKIGMVLTDLSQMRDLFNFYDVDRSGELDYKEFVDMLMGTQGSKTARTSGPSRLHEAENALEKMRQRLAARGSRGIIGLARQFKIMDDDNSKTLDMAEFVKAISDFRVGISESEIESVFVMIDRDRSGHIDYDEFLRALRGPMNAFRKALVKQAFSKLDRDGSGVLDLEDIKGVYNAKAHPDVRAGKKTEDEVLGEFLETFEMHHNVRGTRDRRVTPEEFEEYYNNISCSIDNDQYFELMMSNTWKLSEPPAYSRSKPSPYKRQTKDSERPQKPPNNVSLEILLDKFRSKLATRGSRGFIGIQRQFRIMDDDNSRTISLLEFKKGMKDFRVEVSEDDMERLFNSIDRDCSGQLDYDELLRAIRGPMNSFRRGLVNAAWNKLDRDSSGIVDIEDLKGVYSAKTHPEVRSGKKTEEEVLGEFLETFETHHNISDLSKRDQRVTKEEFEEYYNNISACIDDDRYFELMMNNSWKLNEQPAQRAAWKGEVSSGPNFARGTKRNYQRSQAPWGTDEEPTDYFTSSRPTTRQGNARGAEETVQKMRSRLAARGSRGFIGLSRQFKIMDDDNSKSLDFNEFWKAMRDFRVDITQDEAQILFNYVDADKSGHINYEEFVHRVRGEMNTNRKRLVQRAFEMLDRNGNGVVELDDIKGVYNGKNHPDVRTGKKTEDEVLCEFLDTFEQHHALYKENTRDFRVSPEEFMEYYNHVSASIDDDRYFELMMNNSWNFEGRKSQKAWASKF